MERYFDAHLYTSNYGSRVFFLRLPMGWIDPEKMAPYQVEGAVEVSATGTHLILRFSLDTDSGEYDEDEDNADLLTTLLPIRRALATGDFRALYLGWLAGLQNGLIGQERVEPPVPAGLGDIDDSLNSLIQFLNLPGDLVAAAACKSLPQPSSPGKKEMMKWLSGITPAEKDSWLSGILLDQDPAITCQILNRYRASNPQAHAVSHSKRTAGDLLAAAEQIETLRLDHERQEAEKKERVRIMALVGQESSLWQAVIKLSDSSSANYQTNAIRTLMDLRELAALTGASADFREKIEGFIELRRRKSAFMKRLQEAGLV